MSATKVYLLDGSGYIFRAYYAVAPLSTSQGLPTNALFGFTRMLGKLLSRPDTAHLVVVFDAGRETFRREMYPQYKANRAECPDDLRQQMPFFREITKALGLPQLELAGYEADDLIGTMTTRLREFGHEVVVVSGDKDLLQLVGDGVKVWDSLNDRHFGPAEVAAKMGVPPEKVVELLGLMGDSSDNVPGLNGVGPKTAVQLLEKFGDVAGVIAAAEQIRSDGSIRNRAKIAQRIEEDSAILRLSRKLVEIHCSVPFEFETGSGKISLVDAGEEALLELSRRSAPDGEALTELFQRLEFGSLLKEFNLSVPASVPAQAGCSNCRLVLESGFDSFLRELAAQREFAFDLETTSLDVLKAEVVGASFSWGQGSTFYVPLMHQAIPEGERQVSLDSFKERLAPVFADPERLKCGQNMKYDIAVLAGLGLEVNGVFFDSMLASYLLHPDKGSHNLTVLAADYLGSPVIEFDEVTAGSGDFRSVSLADAGRYAGQDAELVWRLKEKLSPMLEKEGLTRLFDEVEMPLVPVLAHLEREGLLLDTDFLAGLSGEFEAGLSLLRTELYQVAGGEFNLNSPKQLSEILFGKLGISSKGLKKTKSGISTDQSVLEKLSGEHPFVDLILRHRLLFKLKSTYVDALPAQISEVSGRLHTRLNQAVTGTGRLSSSEPNLQNIPITTPEGRRIRAAFVAPKGSLLISADYSQIELRVLAHMSADRNLILDFKEGVDVHAATARQIMGLGPLETPTSEQRRAGKTINFGIVYGMGAFRLARELGIPMRVAEKYIADYFARYSGVKRYFTEMEEQALRDGYVCSMLGRRRYMADLEGQGRDKGFVMRAALNAPIQGSAADLVKLAMVKLAAILSKDKLKLRMLLQIHDELLFECPENCLEDSVALIRREMENVMELRVPLKVDIGWGQNWLEAHD